jgi:hypothetical protein
LEISYAIFPIIGNFPLATFPIIGNFSNDWKTPAHPNKNRSSVYAADHKRYITTQAQASCENTHKQQNKTMKLNTLTLLKRLAALGLIALALFLVAQSTILPGIIEQIVRHALEQAGLPVQQITMRSVSWSQADFSSISAGPNSELTIDTLQVDYDWLSLIGGRVKNIRMAGALYTLDWNQDALMQAGRNALNTGRKRGLPFEEFEISSASLLFLRDKVRFRIPLQGWIRQKPDAVTFSIDCELLGGFTTLTGLTTPDLELQQLTATIRGLNSGMLPNAFFPRSFPAPVQGLLQGRISMEQRLQTWRLASDLSFRFSGTIHGVPFSCDQARLISQIACCTNQGITSLHADLAMEQARIDGYAINNLAVSASNRAHTLEAIIKGNGDEWDFKETRITLTHFASLLPQPFTHDPSRHETPQLTLNVSALHNRINKIRTSIQDALLTADLERRGKMVRLRNTALRIQDGSLAQGSMLVQGIEGTFLIEEFFPLATRGSQAIHIERAAFGGIELNEGHLIFRSEEPNIYRVERLDWVWCGGRLSCLPFSFDVTAPEAKAAVFFEDIALDQFLATTLPEKMDGDAHLFGRVPARLRMTPNMQLTFGKGYLYAVPSLGSVHIHDPSILSEILMGTTSAPSSRAASWRQQIKDAIANYHYSLLKIEFDRIHSNGLSGVITIRGQGTTQDQIPMGLTIPFSMK